MRVCAKNTVLYIVQETVMYNVPVALSAITSTVSSKAICLALASLNSQSVTNNASDSSGVGSSDSFLYIIYACCIC